MKKSNSSVARFFSPGSSFSPPLVVRRKLKLKAKFESGQSYLSVKSNDPGAFNMGFIGSTCTGLPWWC